MINHISGGLDGSTVITWQQLLDEGVRFLAEAGIVEADLDAWYLLSGAFDIDRIHFFLDRNRNVFGARLEKGLPAYQEYLLKRGNRVPIQQILKSQDFMGFTFFVNEHVLIPRQDTETLVEVVLKEHSEKECSVLDMCTGSGCIAIALSVLGGYDQVTAADRSLDALRVAKKNASSLFMVRKDSIKAKSESISESPWGCEMTAIVTAETEPRKGSEKIGLKRNESRMLPLREQKLRLLESDMFTNPMLKEKYDIIVSNPPYIPSAVIEELEPEVRDYEPRMALDGAEDGLYFYKILAKETKKYLNKGGSVYLEIGYDQAEAVSELLLKDGYDEIRVIKDEPGLDRIVTAVWRN